MLVQKLNENEKITSTMELAEYIRNKIDKSKELSDEERAKKDAQILAKLKSGRKLTQEELTYLQRTNPMMYVHAMRVQAIAKQVEEQLKHARSKEEADSIVCNAISGISKDDPDKEFIVAAVNRIAKEMHQSPGYNRLPNTNADLQKSKEKRSEISFKDAEEEKEQNDGFDLSNWSPLQEIIDSMPTFHVGA